MTEDDMKARIEELEAVVRFYASQRAWIGDKEWGVKARGVVKPAGYNIWESENPGGAWFQEEREVNGLKPGTSYCFSETYEYPAGWKSKGESDG